MKKLIMNVLEDMSKGQINLESEAARKTIANSILVAMKTNNNGKGWFLDLSTVDGKPKLTPEEIEQKNYKEYWTCSICGKDTSKVDYDYVGSGTNHLGCELEKQPKVKDLINEYIDACEPTGDDVAKALGHMDKDGNYITEDMPEGLRRAKELSQEAIEEGMRRTKNDMQLEHENKVFDTAGEEIDPVNSYFTADVKDERDSEEYVEDIDEQAHAQGRGSSFGGDTGTDADYILPASEEIDGAYTPDEYEGWEKAVKETETLVDKSVEDFERNKLSEEIIDDKEKDYIYESPDGGETIYRREFGSDEREEIKIEKVKK